MRRWNPLDTIPEVLTLYLFVCISTALVVGFLERWGVGDSVWWVIVTATTTGYGDMAPKTEGGRLLAGAFMLASWLFNLLLGAQVAAKLIVNSDAWTHAEQEETKRLLRKIAHEE